MARPVLRHPRIRIERHLRAHGPLRRRRRPSRRPWPSPGSRTANRVVDFVCEAFADVHDTSAFDSGQPALDDWLRKSARDSDGRNLTRTYVWHRGDQIVVAYYTLMPYIIEREALSTRQGRGLPG